MIKKATGRRVKKGTPISGYVAGEDLEPWQAAFLRDGKLYAYPPKPRRPPLWERAFCFVLDTLTKALDAFTRWIQR